VCYTLCRSRLIFVDVREHGGFSDEWRAQFPQQDDGREAYSLGYRQMVRPSLITTFYSVLIRNMLHLQCQFMSMFWFRALQGYEYAMRVDEDVCITQLPSRELFGALTADYAFGLETDESHLETVETFNPWLSQYMAQNALEAEILPLPTNRIYFTNFFIARTTWWYETEVRRFLDAVDAGGGIFRHRWGDAPIQTAALRLFAERSSVMHLSVR
jgi:hypothetical protein